MATYSISVVEVTNTGHKVISTSGLHNKEEIASIIDARKEDGSIDYELFAIIEGHAAQAIRLSKSLVALITRHK